MKHHVVTNWKEDMAFDSHIDKHILRIDASGDLGNDTGPSPKKLLLTSLTGCTGIDIVSLLKKMRVPFTGLEIEAEADLTEDHPKVYKEIRLTYKVYGKDLPKAKVEKAVNLSKEKYCGVSAMLSKNNPIIYSIEYPDEVSVV
jgi:putative redox protein